MSDTLLSEDAGVQQDAGDSQEVSEQSASPSSGSYKDYFADDGKISGDFVGRYMQWDETADKKALENLLKSNGNDVNRLVKSSLNLSKMLGQEKIPLPKADSDSSVWDEFFHKLGAPQGEDDYKLDDKDVEGIPEDALNGLKTFMKEAKVPQRLASRIVPAFGKMLLDGERQSQEQRETSIQTAVETLQKDWGKRGSDEWKQNLASAKRGAKILAVDYGINDVEAMFDRYGNDPFLLRVFADKGKSGGEGGLPAGVVSDGGQTFTSMDERINELNRIYLKEPNDRNRDILLQARQKRDALRKQSL